jgi:YbbR domain-containing protein
MEADLFMPVRIGKIPDGMILVSSSAKGIEVRVRGPASHITSLRQERFEYTLALSDAHIGMQSIPVNPAQIPLPAGVSIVGISPEALDLEIARERRKALPVTVNCFGEPAPGRRVEKTQAEPSAVILRGPEGIMADIEGVATKPIDITGVAESFKREIPLEIPEGVILDGPAQVITVGVEIGAKIVTRAFKGLAIIGKKNLYPYRITPPVIDILVKGPEQRLEALKKEGGIEVYMDLEGLAPGVYPRRAVLTLPPEITLVSTKPEIFTVTILDNGDKAKGNQDS